VTIQYFKLLVYRQFVFSIAFGDPLFFIEKKSGQKILGKINALLEATTRPHLFCRAARARTCSAAKFFVKAINYRTISKGDQKVN